MQYSSIRSRAGLVVLVFALIISFVSAVPIPVAESGHSSTLSRRSDPSLNEQDHIQRSSSGRMSTLPAAATRALTRRQHIMDDQLVPRSVGSKINKVVQSVGKVVGKAINVVSKAAGAISDRIHVKLSSKLQKGMNVMNKGDKIMDYIPRRRDFSEEEAFQQRGYR